MKTIILFGVLSIAAAAAGCGFERRSGSTGPSATGGNALMGTWTSTNVIPSASSCTNFKWSATEATATSAKGSFSATCAGDLNVSGTAEGQFAPNATSIIQWKANGTATAPGLNNCSITLQGTAELGVDSIRIPYTGETCLGKVAGVENLKR